jgi:hypothetical protein
MKAVLDLISQYVDAVCEYEKHLPHATGQWRETLLWHRDFNLRIIADLRRIIAPNAA